LSKRLILRDRIGPVSGFARFFGRALLLARQGLGHLLDWARIDFSVPDFWLVVVLLFLIYLFVYLFIRFVVFGYFFVFVLLRW
jgi:hypothetical protein